MWNDVELLTNEDTNTIRLYNDNISRDESSSGLYQVDTLVKISTPEKVNKPETITYNHGPFHANLQKSY